jgi:chloride channel 7
MNVLINKYRKMFLKTNLLKLIEAVVLVSVIATVVFFIPKAVGCRSTDDTSLDYKTYDCPDGEYNVLATLFFNSEGAVIKIFMKWSTEGDFDLKSLFLFFLIWYVFTIITYGTFIPAGLFLPGILIGCAFGMLIGLMLSKMDFGFTFNPETYAIIGATGILAGYSRLTFSLIVLMMETSENVNLFMPVLCTCLAANWTGELFIPSLYKKAIKSKNIPFLGRDIPS